MKRCYLVVLFVAVIVIVNVLYAFYYAPRTHTIQQKIVLGDVRPGYASLKLTASYDIKVYRQGELVVTRHKENDPITIQWYRMIANMLFGFIRDGAVKWLDVSGIERTWVDIGACDYDCPYSCYVTQYDYPKPYIALGSGAGTPSTNDYKLFNEVAKDVADVSVVDDTINSQYIITYTKSFTISTSFTLTEVGLLLRLDVDKDRGTAWVYILVAHDSVSPSVGLVSGDVVTVTYQIVIPYSVNGPFTRWFYNGLINYFLGYKGATNGLLTMKAESSNSGGIDTGLDRTSDSVSGEYVYVEIGNSTSGVNPIWETYSLGNMLQRTRIDDQQFLNEINETNTYTIHYVVSFTFTSSASVSEIGVSYYTDRDDGSGAVADYYLWLYWNLASPINVDTGDGLRVEITIEIPYT